MERHGSNDNCLRSGEKCDKEDVPPSSRCVLGTLHSQCWSLGFNGDYVNSDDCYLFIWGSGDSDRVYR